MERGGKTSGDLDGWMYKEGVVILKGVLLFCRIAVFFWVCCHYFESKGQKKLSGLILLFYSTSDSNPKALAPSKKAPVITVVKALL